MRITRTTLRPAFYSQSYVVVPLVFAVSLAGQVIMANPNPTGALICLVIIVAGVTWFLAVETIWLSQRTQRSMWWTSALSVLNLVIGFALLAVAGAAVGLAPRGPN